MPTFGDIRMKRPGEEISKSFEDFMNLLTIYIRQIDREVAR
jgi:hypothetical protein